MIMLRQRRGVGNISYDDLASLTGAFNKTPKPKLKTGSLDDAARAINFGMPENHGKTPTNDLKIKINISSPTIKKNIVKSVDTKDKLVQEADIEKLISGNEFSSQSISFIPYSAGFITASEALEKITNDYENFYTLQQNYLSDDNLKFILTKIDKIYDLSQKDKNNLIHFYRTILDIKAQARQKRVKAETALEKIKTKVFREKLGSEIARMMKGSGDLYQYYISIDLIDSEVKKHFLNRIGEIDYYIIKKIKELVTFTKTDINFRFEEIMEFLNVIKTRNILMENFHSQVEQVVRQKKLSDDHHLQIEKTINALESLARDYGRLGTYGRQIFRSDSLLNQVKINYFQTIATLIQPSIIKAQGLILDLETGNFISLEKMKDAIDAIDVKEIKNKCDDIFTKTYKQKI